jgi:hypothetical protein
MAMTTLDDLLSSKAFNAEEGVKRVDRVNSNVVYIGLAAYGSATSAAAWRIARISIQGTQTVTEYAAGGAYTQIWNNRTSLFSALPWMNTFAWLLDGVNDYGDMGDVATLNKERTDPWTWSFRYRPRIVTSQQTLYSKRTTGGVGIEIKMLANGRIDVILQNGGANLIRVQTTNSLLPMTYQNIVVTYDGSSTAAGVKIYVNSLSHATSLVSNSLSASILTSQSATFGQYAGLNFLDGYLDEIAFFSAALAQDKVTELFNGNVTMDLRTHSSSANLVHYWQMGDNDTYPTLSDLVANADITMINSSSSAIVELVA